MLHELFLDSAGVFTDSRNVLPNGIFIALKGASFDGNGFAIACLEKGAKAAVVSDPALKDQPGCIWVEDTLVALQQLAREHRRKSGVQVLGIAGSNGKTTTKELVSRVLGSRFRIHATPGNFNNHIGLPLTILGMPKDTEILILEMGSNHSGELAVLCEIGEPNFGLLTSLGKEHLEGFGTFEAVVEEEGALFDYLDKSNGVKFVLTDDLILKDRAGNLKSAFTYGTADDNDCVGKFAAADPFVKFQWNFAMPPEPTDPMLETKLIGHFNFYNLLAACCVGRYFGVPFHLISEALCGYQPTNNRSQHLQIGNVQVLMDAYNANPGSMVLAIDNFERNIQSTEKIAVLGDMFELGSAEFEEHKAIVEQIKATSFSKIFLVGKAFADQISNFDARMVSALDTEELHSKFPFRAIESGWVLVKGSRGVALEKWVNHA